MVDFVIETINQQLKKYEAVLDNIVIVHSDQGFHYTSHTFIEKLKDSKFLQSMSRKGNCWDNAPQESFFGRMKDEIRDLIKNYKFFKEVEYIIDEWID